MIPALEEHTTNGGHVAIARYNVLGIRVASVDYERVVEAVIAAAREKRSLTVSALAVHGVMTGALDPCHCYRLNRFDILCPDGQPVRWALNILHRLHLRDRVYGPTLMLKICERAAAEALPVYLFGSTAETLVALSRKLGSRIPGLILAGSQPSRFRRITEAERLADASAIFGSGAAIVFVGIGCPRQEIWAFEMRSLLQMPVVAVGAAFDFHSGLLRQAPAAMQRLGLEWLFRLACEPRRLWRRYLTLNPRFVCRVAKQWLRSSRNISSVEKAPRTLMRYG